MSDIISQRIKAVMDAATARLEEMYCGVRYVTNGHAIVATDDEFTPAETIKVGSIAKILGAFNAEAKESTVGSLHEGFKYFYRRIGAEAINEALYRMFPVGATWWRMPSRLMVVTLNGAIIGAVMPLRLCDPREDRSAIIEPPSDVDVYREYACEANGWAFQPDGFSDEKQSERLAELEDELAEKESELEDLEAEIQDIEDEIAKLRAVAA